MKRNELLAKSLTLGLAVATAATSMSVPGGLLAPQTAYAAEEGETTTDNSESKVTLSDKNVTDYFTLSDQPIVAVTLNGLTVTEVNGPLIECVKEGTSVIDGKLYGKLTTTFKDSDEKDVEYNNLEVGKKYNAYINVDGNGSALAAADEPVKLGEVTVYEDLGDNATLTYKDGADDAAGVTDLTGKEFKNDVVISVSDGATISTSSTVGDDTSVTISRGDIVSGSLPVVLYVKKGETTYAKIVELKFAQKTAIAGTVSITDNKDADISKLAVGDTIKAKYESGNATNAKYQWYRVPAEGEAEAIEGATEETYTVTTDDLGYTLKVVVSDADLSGTQNATTSVAVAKKDYEGEAPKFGESCFDEAARTLTATVADGTTAAQLEYSLDGGTTWTKGNADDTILTVDGTSAELTLDAKAYEANKIQIRVAATDDTEASEAATYATAISRKGVDLSTATVKINGATQTSFTYTGTDVITSVAVDGLEDTKYKVYYTDSKATEAGTNTTAPTAVGEYKLWIVPAEGADEDCYGNQAVAFSIKAVEVTSENIATYIDYTSLNEAKLTYSKGGKAGELFDYVTVKDEYADEIPECELVFQKTTAQSENTASQADGYLDDISDAGTYKVFVKIDAQNIKTPAPVEIGTVTIDKYQTKDSDIVVEGKTVTYNGQPAAAEVSSVRVGLDKSKVKLIYKKDGQEVASPTNVGTYEVYVSYEGDNNCEELTTGTEIKDYLVIEKATDQLSVSPIVVKPDTEDACEYDLRTALEKWTKGTNDAITADSVTLTPDESGKDLIADLKYDANSKKITFSLSDEGKALKEQKEFAIHVDFGESFTNYNVAFDIPVIITDKSPVSIEVNEKDALTYDGQEKSLTYKISGDDFTEISSATNDTENFTVTITKDGEEVSEIKDAGTYVVTAEYASETNYGKLVQEVTVTPKMVTEVEDLFTLGSLDLKYDMKTNFFDKIIAAVEAKADAGITDDDYTIWVDQTVDTADGYSLAGDATVSIEITGGNYRTNGKVQLGTVTIAKGTIALTVTATNKGEVTVKVGDKVIPNDDVTIEYYKGDAKLDAKPTEPGDYKVKVIYTDDANLTAPATGEAAFTIPTSGGNTSGGSTSGGSSSSGGGSATTPSKDDTKKDDNSKTETKPDGTKVTTTETKAEDGSVQTKIELKNDTTGVDATVNVAKDAQGKVTGATADVIQKSSDNKTAISAATVAQITEAAGTKDVEITTKTVDAQGQTVREVTVNASDLTAGKKLKVVMVDPKTGEKTLVNKTTYKVAADGSLALNNLGDGSYEVVTTAELNALTKEILKTVKPDKTKKNVTVGKKTKFTLNDELNMDNVAKITYKTGKKSVATVNANGTITAKKAGKVTIKAVVTLNNGKKKTIKMTITVKKKK